MPSNSIRSIVKEFVTTVLGCQCPDEVFHEIETLMEDSYLRILIGNRLMVQLFPLGKKAGSITTERLLEVFKKGRDERDLRGLNRFRLVLIINDGDASRQRVEGLANKVQEAFKKTQGNDDRMHLHVVSEKEVPEVLRVMAGMMVL